MARKKKRSRKKTGKSIIRKRKKWIYHKNTDVLDVGRGNFHVPPAVQGCQGHSPIFTTSRSSPSAVQKKREAGGSEQGTSRSVCCSGRWWQPRLVPSNGQGTLLASRTALLWREGQGTAQSDCKMCCWQQQALSKPSPGDWVCFLLIGEFLATFSAIKNNLKIYPI